MHDSNDCLCPKYCRAVSILGKRWTCMILSTLMDGPRRFSEIEHSVPGIGGRMLSERLKDLENNGVVERCRTGEAPGRAEYRLTPKGFGLKPVIDAIHVWANRWDGEVDDAVSLRIGA